MTQMSNVQSHENQFKSSAVAKPAPKKSVFWIILVIVCIIFVLGAVSAFRYFNLFANDSSVPSSVIFEEVKRGVFLHEVTDRGNVESAQNEDIRCNVESMSGVLIVWIIPEGTAVEEGEVLVRLDSSNLEERLANQEILVLNTEAAKIQAAADLRVAELALDEYEKGTLVKERITIRNKILKVQEDKDRAIDNRDYTKKLYAQGYVSDLQLKADDVRLEQLQNDLESAEKEKFVLEEYTKPKMFEQYSANIETAKTQKLSAERRNSIETTRKNYLEKQVAYCTIRAPKAGQVVYASPSGPFRRDNEIIKEGNTARERQVLLRLPDPKQMQVAGMVNEASVSLVKVGQPATITLQAMPNQVFNGTVKQVNDYPEPDGFMGSMAKEYKTIITMDGLDNLPPNIRAGIRPGLTAQIKIDVTDPSIEDMPILVPVQTLFENSGKYYCITCDNGKWEKVEVEVGATNDKEVVIKSGLSEGTRVVQGAWRYIDRVLTEEERTSAREFGIGGARRRGGAGGPGRGPGGSGGPPSGFDGPSGSGTGSLGGFGGQGGGPDGPGRGQGADLTPPTGGPNASDRKPDAMPTNSESQPVTETRDNSVPPTNMERPSNSAGESDMRENPGDRQPPTGGDFRSNRPPSLSENSSNSPPLSPPSGNAPQN